MTVIENSNEATVVQGKIITSEEAYRRRRSKEREEALYNTLLAAGLGGTAFATAVMINRNPQLAELFAKLPGANRYSEKHKKALQKTLSVGVQATDISQNFKQQTFGRSLLSIALSLEELTPFGIAKTLQTTNIVEPLVGFDVQNTDIKFTGSAITAHSDYYYALIREASKGKHKLEKTDLAHGFTLRNGALYRNLSDGTIDLNSKILDYVRPVTSYVQFGEHESPNRILAQFAHMHGTTLGWNAFDKEQMAFIAGSSKFDLARKWTTAIARQSMEIGFKTLDNPVAGIEELVRATGAENIGLFDNETYKKVRNLANIQLGPGGNYHDSLGKLTFRTAKRLATTGIGLYTGYHAISGLLDTITPDSSIWSEGLLEGLTYNYTQARIGAAKILADPFQDYKQKQEEAADGSTSLITLAGLPITGATFGASLPYFKRMFDSGTKGIEKALDISDSATHSYGILEPITKRLGLGPTTLTKSFAMHGAIAGALVALPFLPGALIGKSSKELEDEYNGDALVANRKNRFWFTGSDHFEGGEIKNFQPSSIARLLSGGSDEVRYGGDESLKRSLDPLLNPIGFLKNPYRYEEMHQKDQPYPVWGMDVSFGSFLGKAFQGTVGEIIKPTVINPVFEEQMKQDVNAPIPTHKRTILNYISSVKDELNRHVEGDIMYEVKQNDPANLSGGYDLVQEQVNRIRATDEGLSTLKDGTRHYDNVRTTQGGAYPVSYNAKPEERRLIDDGLMIARESPDVNPYQISFGQTYNALSDFAGIKGFTGTLIASQFGIDPTDTRAQLARSGDARSGSEDFLDQNLGDVFGLGEFQRRILPSSSSSQIEYINPMMNSVAPWWLPSNEERYYKNFQVGDYYSKVRLGEYRLPGVGYEAWNKELSGLDPNDYPLVHQYRILSDVAPGSEEQIALKKRLFEHRAQGQMSEAEENLFFETLTQEQAKANKKQFSEYRTDEQKDRMSYVMGGLSNLWEFVTHNAESPIEPLTPFRPGAKFIHKRTAIEDYESAMVRGTDSSIWTNPYSHFIKPTINNLSEIILPGTQTPSEAQERDAFDEYFDKLEYMKARRNDRINDALRTTHGITYAGILDADDFNKFKRSVSPDQQDYVDAFAKETDTERRERILELVPTDIGRAYREVWKNLDIAEEAKEDGVSIDEAIKENFVKETKRHFGGIGDTYSSSLDEQVQLARQVRLQAADEEAQHIVNKVTGTPSDGWLGWDPRLSMDEVKIRTLTVGKEDIYRHGYWDSDVQRNDRIIALDTVKEVTHEYNRIVDRMREQNYKKANLESALRRHGFESKRIIFSPATENHLDLRLE